jgi:hypothetical protein
MNDPREARLARVERMVAAGRRAADPGNDFGREVRAALVATSGLSPEGVELALSQHLETDPTPEHLDALLASSGTAPRCHLVLAANVCTAALRALAVATATAPVVFVRPSRRDPALATLLTRALGADPAFASVGGTVTLVDAITAAPGDELHLHGSDATVRELTSASPPGVVVRGHGTGLGVALVGAGDALDDAAMAVARDVIPFDQRGCLSPRAVLTEGDSERALAFARALHGALADLSARVPRGPIDAATAAEIAAYRATVEAVGDLWGGRDHVIGLDPTPRALLVPPAARVVHVVPVASAERAAALLGPLASYLTTVGSSDSGGITRAVRALAPRARHARLGEMQRPPLDGPVDLRLR